MSGIQTGSKAMSGYPADTQDERRLTRNFTAFENEVCCRKGPDGTVHIPEYSR